MDTTQPDTTGADRLTEILMSQDVAAALWAAVESGEMDQLVPEFGELKMEQHPVHHHKDVLAHTIIVVGKTPNDLHVRLAAFFHDIAKPKTRSFEHGGVTFRHHEAAGARIARRRMTALGFGGEVVDDVSELVRLSGRFKGYADGWSDSAVRRYAREAGPLLARLNALVRSDCTTRNKSKEEALQRSIDELESRIADLADQQRRQAERPQVDGSAVMKHLEIGPGREVGDAMRWLLALKRSEGELPDDEIYRRLDEWWAGSRVRD